MSIPLGGPKTVTYARAGARVFNSAKHAFQGQFSCRSCHPDGHVDGLVYDLESDGVGKDIVDNRTLRELQGSTPLKWSGVSSSLYRQCGPRFAMFISRSEALEPATLLSLVAYIQSIRHPPRGDETERELTPAQARGKAIFERTTDNFRRPIPVENRCNTCHPPPRYTDRRQHDVGSGKQSDASKRFDTPGLEGVAHNAPYLHDGSSPTLEEIWTRFNDADRHGVSSDMTKEQMNDLVEYLKTL